MPGGNARRQRQCAELAGYIPKDEGASQDLDRSVPVKFISRRTKRPREENDVIIDSHSKLPLPASEYPFHLPARDSGVTAQRAFQWLLSPLSVAKFFDDHYEKKPCLLRAKLDAVDRFSCLVSVDDVRRLLQRSDAHSKSSTFRVLYGRDVDVTRYNTNEGRRTFNGASNSPAGTESWTMFQEKGCSIRLLRPQEHFDPLWALCSMLETFFGTVVGANVYLTPPSSQGFAPHYDDIDAFVCQVSGRKRWRVYAPRGDGCDILPRRSSVDFSSEEMKDVDVLFDSVLCPGDLLYLPRGCIHQAECPEESSTDENARVVDGGSLHVTISACQKSTWADLLMETFATAVLSASHEHMNLRRNLPLRFSDYVGVGCADQDEARRKRFDSALRKSMRAVASFYPIDSAADVLAEQFMKERLPPWDLPARFDQSGGACIPSRGLGPASVVRAVGRGVARVVMDKDGDLPIVVHCLHNSRETRRKPLRDEEGECGRLSCTPDEAFAIDGILKAYPNGVRVDGIHLEKSEDRQALAEILAEVGLVYVL